MAGSGSLPALPSTATAAEIAVFQGGGKGFARQPPAMQPPATQPPAVPGSLQPKTPPDARPSAAMVAAKFAPAPGGHNVAPALHNAILKLMIMGSLNLKLNKLRWCWKCYSMSWFTGGSCCTNPGCHMFKFGDLLPGLQFPELYCSIHDLILLICDTENLRDVMQAAQLVKLEHFEFPCLDHVMHAAPPQSQEELPDEEPADDLRMTGATAAPKAKAKAKGKAKAKAKAKAVTIKDITKQKKA